jgi:UDPglucose 6-dehydrogenase
MCEVVKSSQSVSQDEKILQVGCGVVGSANIKGYKYHGFPVLGLDICEPIIKQMNKDGIDCRHPNDDLSDWNDVSVILISVQTPLDKETNRLTMKYLFTTVETIAKIINQNTTSRKTIVVMRSTVYPGFTRLFESEVKKHTDKDFFIAFQPEFLRAVTAEEDACHPWKVLFGYNEEDWEVKDRMTKMLLRFVNNNPKDLRVLNMEEAEIHKCIHNYSNGLRISFANAMYVLMNNINKELGVAMRPQHVLNVVSDTAESFLNPKYGIRVGAPYGGVCLPKDCPELIGMAKQYNLDSELFKFLNGVEETNKYIAEHSELHVEMDESPNLMKFSDLKK